MAIQTIKSKVMNISKTGRIMTVLSNPRYFTNKTINKVEIGRTYQFTVDDLRGLIIKIVPIALTEKSIPDDFLNAEIDRLNAIITVYREYIQSTGDITEFDLHLATCAGNDRIPADSYLYEMGRIGQYMEAQEARIDCENGCDDKGWISYTSNPMLAARLWNRLGSEDTIKSTGKSIRTRIAELCETVPEGLIPDEIKYAMEGMSNQLSY